MADKVEVQFVVQANSGRGWYNYDLPLSLEEARQRLATFIELSPSRQFRAIERTITTIDRVIE